MRRPLPLLGCLWVLLGCGCVVETDSISADIRDASRASQCAAVEPRTECESCQRSRCCADSLRCDEVEGCPCVTYCLLEGSGSSSLEMCKLNCGTPHEDAAEFLAACAWETCRDACWPAVRKTTTDAPEKI